MTGHIDPTKEAFAAFRANDREGPIHMLNLVRLRARANYPDGRKATGAEAYAAYGRESRPVFARLGGRIVWRGTFEQMVIGPSEERWDHCFIAEYPSVAAFVEMTISHSETACIPRSLWQRRSHFPHTSPTPAHWRYTFPPGRPRRAWSQQTRRAARIPSRAPKT